MSVEEEKTAPITAEIQDTTKNKYLTMIVGHELFGIEIGNISEIIGMVNITQVPKSPNHVKGIINLRGDIVPVVDVRLRFSLEERPYDDVTCIVVIEQEGFNVGLIVDGVKDVKYIKDEDISNPPSVKLNYANKYIRNIGRSGDEVIMLIDIFKILYEEDI